MNEASQELIVREIARCQPRLRALVRCLLVRCSDVDDVLQEINAVQWEKADEFKPGTNFWAWASQIVRYKVLNQLRNYPGVVYRIDPARNFAVTTELDIRDYFAKAFGVAELRGPCLGAYNEVLPVTDPDTGEKVLLLGVWINHPGRRTTAEGSSAWYLVRHADGTYSHGRVFDPAHPRPNPPRGLLATRTIEVSPFPDDAGRVLYFGGFDRAGIVSHNTAWIYKGTLPNQRQ